MTTTHHPVVMVLPNQGYDPSEAAVTWKMLVDSGLHVVFATPNGKPALADPIMVTGEGLDWWGGLPLFKHIKFIGMILRANKAARKAYREMLNTAAYHAPMRYEDIDPAAIAGLVFPGGHDKAIKPFLESETLRDIVRQAMSSDDKHQQLPIAGICHGVLVLARAQDSAGQSVLFNRKVTALPWSFEKKAWTLSRIFRFWDPHYYRTYLESKHEPAGHWSVEAEIKRYLKHPSQFALPQPQEPHYRLKTDGIHRDALDNNRPSWVVRDGNLVTGRWPGDAHEFGRVFARVVTEYQLKNRKASPVIILRKYC